MGNTTSSDKKRGNDDSVPKSSFDLTIPLQALEAFIPRPEKGRPGGSSADIQYFDLTQTKKCWVGKCGINAVLESNYVWEYKEALALKLYALFGVKTPNIALSPQVLAKSVQEQEYRESAIQAINLPRLHIMSEWMDGYKDLGSGFLQTYKKLGKDSHYSVNSHQSIPLRGFGRALAVAAFLHDYDCVGSSGGNMGYVVEPMGTFAEVVKIDPGEALGLVLPEELKFDPAQRKIRIGMPKKGPEVPVLLFKDLTEADQKEFIETVEKILACPKETLGALFNQKVLIDGIGSKTADEWFDLLWARRDFFIAAYGPEVSVILQQRKLKMEHDKALVFSSAPTSNSSLNTNLTAPSLNKNPNSASSTSSSHSSSSSTSSNSNTISLQSQLAASELRASTRYESLARAHLVPQKPDQKIAVETYQLPPKKLFVGRKEALEFLEKHFSNPQENRCCIQGSGGMGKTQLATEYLYRALEAKRYQRVIWLYAEQGQLLNQMTLLVEAWYDIKAQDLDQNTLVKQFYEYLASAPTCLVIDNAVDEASITAFLPPQNSKVHLLISSRYQNWKTVPGLALKTFSSEETTLYLNQFLGKNLKEAEELTQLLGGLPLALVQAAAYIKQKNLSVAEYAQLFSKSPALLSEQADANASTVATTLTLAIKDLTDKDKKLGDLFFLFTYLSPDHINIPLFQSLSKLSVGKPNNWNDEAKASTKVSWESQ